MNDLERMMLPDAYFIVNGNTIVVKTEVENVPGCKVVCMAPDADLLSKFISDCYERGKYL